MRRQRSQSEGEQSTPPTGHEQSGQPHPFHSIPTSVPRRSRARGKGPSVGRRPRHLAARRQAEVADPAGHRSPDRLTLYQNLPNPFSEQTIIGFLVPHGRAWRVKIEDIEGRVVRNFEGNKGGTITLVWNGSDDAGVSVPSGIYYYELESDHVADRRKMTLIR